MKIAVIGGGWAGLSAAIELSAAGCAVSLFEASKTLGGRARDVHSQGRPLDNGQHILSGAYQEILRLMRLIGLDPEQALKRVPLELNAPGAGFLLKLAQLPAPAHLAVGLLSASGSSCAEKWAAARMMRALEKQAFRLPQDMSVSQLLDLHAQHGTLRFFLWESLCLAALNTPAQEASAQVFINVLRDSLSGQKITREHSDLLLPARPLGQIFPEPAAQFIRAKGGLVQCATRIKNFSDPFSLAGERFTHCILALAPQHAQHLLAQHPQTQALAELLGSYTYQPIATVYLGYPPDVRLPRPMLALDSRSTDAGAQRFGQWVFDRAQLLASAPESTQQHEARVMAFVLSAHGAWENQSQAALAQALHHELCAALGQNLPPPIWQQMINERRATFTCRPNLKRLSAQTPLKNLWLAGDYVYADYPATLEGAVRSGVAAAQGILKS